jgi:hypothetical protein
MHVLCPRFFGWSTKHVCLSCRAECLASYINTVFNSKLKIMRNLGLVIDLNSDAITLLIYYPVDLLPYLFDCVSTDKGRRYNLFPLS